MLAELLVSFCAPTLAGLKVSNLFSYKYVSLLDVEDEVLAFNKLLNDKGIFFHILRAKDNIALIYVYRKGTLKRILKNEQVREFLSLYEYRLFDIENSIELLKTHLQNQEFPHEIGIFLGYPLNDVIAFIENKGKSCEYTGYWKVYTDKEEAIKLFNKFDKCTKVYKKRFYEGFTINKLAITG